MTHTPGPWVIFHCDGISSIMPAMREGEIATNIRNDDDARLIASAPELVAALKGLMAFTEFQFSQLPQAKDARAALAKVKEEK